ncbi:pyridoxal phosphate-dependent aminotransferase [Mucilaginibacter sp. HD30]
MANINRRTWIRTSALMAGGAAFLRGGVEKLSAMPVLTRAKTTAIKEQTFLESIPPELKARLNANENPFGPSPAVKKAIQDTIDIGFRYPINLYGQLVDKIATFEGVKRENILMNAGSSPLLLAAAMEYSKGGKSIITGDPSYDDLPSTAEGFGGKWIKVPLTPEFKLDLDAMEAKVDDNTGLVYICNPNNPTATILDTAKLKAFIERVSKKAPVFIDEAYIDYLPDPKAASMMSAVIAGHNVIVARTFSKLYGFAGLRCGYLIAQPKTVDMLGNLTSGAFNMSATTVAGAIAGYNETAFLQDALKKTNASKEFLYSVLKKEGYNYITSSTNFVLFPIKMEGRKFAEEMAKRSVGIRTWQIANQHYCRVSIGTMDEMTAFAEAFKQIS